MVPGFPTPCEGSSRNGQALEDAASAGSAKGRHQQVVALAA